MEQSLQTTILKLFDLYTSMARELCETLVTSAMGDNLDGLQMKAGATCFEEAFDLALEQMEFDRPIEYKGDLWDWHEHGEHCLFVSNSRLEIEANIYDTNLVDAAFFGRFLRVYPEAQSLVSRIGEPRFELIIRLFDELVLEQQLIRFDGTQYKRSSSMTLM